MRRLPNETLLWLSILCLPLGCGSGGSHSEMSLSALSLEKDSLELHQQTKLHIRFQFAAPFIFEEDGHLSILIRFPEELDIRKETSKIKTAEHTEKVSEQIIPCQKTEETFVLYDIDANNLEGSEASAELIVTVDSKQKSDAAVISVAIAESPPVFSCGQNFSGDEEIQLSVF